MREPRFTDVRMTDSTLADDDALAPAEYLGDLTVVARLSGINEALTLKGCLEAAGVPATIGDQLLMTQNSWLNTASGGVRVLVPATLVPRANEVIAQYRNGAFEIEGDVDPDLPPATTTTTVALWSPDLAAWFSMLLTPIFGATLHWMNSRALGERKLQRAATTWLVLSFVATSVGFWLLRGQEWSVTMPLRVSGVLSIYTATWYLFGAHAQSRFITRSFGIKYPHHRMLKAVAFAVALLLAIGAAGSALGSD
jgi:hypothetical protein